MYNEKLICQIEEALLKTRKNKPLIEQLTNFVTINDCANATLSIGASPVMADGDEEVEAMTSLSDALVINFGIINLQSVNTMIKAAKVANKCNVPVVFDPVGMGSIPFINESCLNFLNEVKIDIIKGNASEIMALAKTNVKTKGVDSLASSEEAIESAVKVARTYRCVCAVTGEIDVVTDGKYLVKMRNGSDILSYITGTGCMIASLIGSIVAANNPPLVSACAGILAMSISGEKAMERERKENNGIATYRVDLMNNIYHFTGEDVRRYAQIEVEKLDSQYSMYLVTDEKACKGKNFYKSIEDAILGGAKIVQLREKNLSTREFYERALKVKEICQKYDVKFVINDRIDICQAVDADGVHLGQSDMSIDICKKIIGYKKIVGISVKTIEQAEEAERFGADYIGVGAIFGTDSKKDAEVIDKDVLKEICVKTNIPVLAIGGIKLENLDYLNDVDIDGICVISDILNDDNCKKRTEDLIKRFKEVSNNKKL